MALTPLPQEGINRNLPKVELTENKSKGNQQCHKSHTMLAQDSFLGSLLVLPVELWNGIAG